MDLLPLSSWGDANLNHYHLLWTPIWRGNISPILSKDAAVNYISKYASKAETMSSELDKCILELTSNMPDSDGIQLIITKTLNKFCIERDFSAQEACHQVIGLPMVECSRAFDSIHLPMDLTVTRVLAAEHPQRNSNAIGLRAARRTSTSKMEKYMVRHQDLGDISYLDMVRRFKWGESGWERRRNEAIVSINPKSWYKALRKDPSKPNNGQTGEVFATAARRAVMLYIPFRSIEGALQLLSVSRPPCCPRPLWLRCG